MAPDLISLPAATPVRTLPGETPDLAVAALPFLTHLCDALVRAGRFRDACRRAEARASRWQVPPLFFFHRKPQDTPSHRVAFPAPFDAAVARTDPTGAAAWHALPDLADDAESLLSAAVEVRRTARAVAGLSEAAAALAVDHPRAARLARMLAIPDDEVVLVLHPQAGAGWRVRVRGVADFAQFQTLLADGIAFGPRPRPAVVEAYRNRAGYGPVPVVQAAFQLFRPQAVLSDGTLPTGFDGSDHWLWPHQPLSRVPLFDGERVVLLGEPAFPATWDAVPAFSLLPADLSVVEAVSTAAVDEWLRTWAGASPVRTVPSLRLAA